MGKPSSIDLYFRVENLRRAFDALIELSEPSLTHRVFLTLAPDQRLELALQTDVDHAFLIQPGDSVVCQVSLLCPYEDDQFPGPSRLEWPIRIDHGTPFYLFPPLRLSVRLGHRFVQFSFEATPAMEDLFLHARAVQRVFLDVFKLGHGHGAILHNIRDSLHCALENPSLAWDQALDALDADRLPPDSVDQSAAQLFQRHNQLDMNWSDAEAQIDFFRRWVQPYYLERITGTPADLNFDANYAEKTRSALVDINEEIFDRLYFDTNWRSHAAGYWLAGIKRVSTHTQTIGIAMRARPTHARGQVFALTRFNNPLAIHHLKRYLDTLLQVEWEPFGNDNQYSVDWALAALVILDAQNGTHNAAPYLESGGLLDGFTQHGLDYFEATYPRDWLKNFTDNWHPRQHVESAKAHLQRGLEFASTYFPEY